jgi:hypothetical protein
MSGGFEQQIRHDFERARHRAFLHELFAVFANRPNDLIPYHEVRSRVAPQAESYRGLQTVPLDKIVGSMDRFRDFDRAFLPRQRFTAGRWQNVDRAWYEDKRLPPIQLYKVGDVYFVKDGNHRVSVAREKGQEYIDAEVIEGHIRAPLAATMRPAELLLQAEYAEFLHRTNLDRLQPEHDIRPTALGRYDEIWQHIDGHRHWLEAIRHAEVPVSEAVQDWYTYIYEPIVRVARERGVTERFPNHTEADIYLWVIRHRWELERQLGRDIGPAPAAEDYAARIAPPASLRERALGPARTLVEWPRRVIQRMMRGRAAG